MKYIDRLVATVLLLSVIIGDQGLATWVDTVAHYTSCFCAGWVMYLIFKKKS